MTYVIGVDGGGTKTHAVLADQEGYVLKEVVVGPTNPNSLTDEQLEKTFEQLFTQFREQVPTEFLQVIRIFAGISGAASVETKAKVYRVIAGLVPSNIEVQVEPDTINALYSGTYGAPGMVQICGTGSVTYGVNANGVHDRVGGWGYLLGDEGSGYDIGKQGLIAALKYYDQRGPKTTLLHLLYDHFQVETGRQLVDKVYLATTPKHEIARLSKLVFQASLDGDAVATNIIHCIVREICLSIATLHKKLFDPNEKVKVILCGGVFNEKTNQLLLPLMRQEMINDHVDVNLVIPNLPPVGGSVIGAYQKDQIEKSIVEKLIQQLNH
ncbi:N-acetylglucosamine kinase [Aquibacillus sediminis]|uniref:N-acetylglucosamine kinase n=1 Tax=Aquibacillus sediminis TaxID=2574734 RepID=UPI0014866A9B|nr:BadF/BadG/BcrA/BcrD ATPase family protein [Aquibacillus sediminis]